MKKNKAFTLAETLLTLGLISVLLITSLSLVKTKANQQIFKGYKAAYIMLSETSSSINDNLKGNVGLTSKWNLTSDGLVKATGKSIFMENPTNNGLMCEIFSDYMNTIKSNCEFPLISINAETIEDNRFHIILSNSMRIGFGPEIALPINKNGLGDVPFRVIFVDINGKGGGPNKITNNTDTNNNIVEYADIIPFVILPDGKVLPIGVQELNAKYVSSRVLYPPFITNSSGNPVQNSKEISANVSFFEAKCKAWGNTTDALDPLSYDYVSALGDAKNTFLKGYNKPTCNINTDIDKNYGCTLAPSKCYVLLNKD